MSFRQEDNLFGSINWPSIGKYMAIKATTLGLAEFGKVELVRRVMASVIIAGWYAVGWSVTPDSVKGEGWEYIKRITF